jgi:hypothetical protein
MFLGLQDPDSLVRGKDLAKIVRKTFIPPVIGLLYDFLSVKNDVNVALKSNKQKNLRVEVTDENEGFGVGSGSVSQRYGSADPDPYQNARDP